MSEPMIKNGYVLLPRIVLEGLGGRTPLTVALYVWLLCRASHKTRQGFGRTYLRGQLLTSIDMMRDAMKYKIGYRWQRPTKKMLRRTLEGLTEGSLIGTAKTTRGLIVTICQYDFYQNPANYERCDEGRTKVSANDQNGAHYIQELKNDKNGRGKPHSFPYKSFDQLDKERAAAATDKAKQEFLKNGEK